MNTHTNRARSASPNAEDDPDLALAIELSLKQDENQETNKADPALASSQVPGQLSKPASAVSFGSLALDRKKMEEERLARINKRSAAQAGLDKQPQKSKLQRPRAPGCDENAISTNSTKNKVEASNSAEEGNNGIRLPFPQGTFKRTWALGYARTGEDIKVEEVLQKEKLQLAVLSSFQWDEEWLLSKIDCSRTKMILVAYAANEAEKAMIRANAPAGLIRFCFPPMHGGYMHSKLQILKYEGYLRIAVPSGNLVPYDWGETGVIENMVFIIDLPRRCSTQQDVAAETSFGNELRRFLRALGLEEKLVQSLDNYDFSETKRYGFVHSIAGTHADGSWQHTGYCGLGSTVRSMGLANNDPVHVDYVASSLGSLNYDYLTAIYNACQGDSGLKEYEARQSRSTRTKAGRAGSVASRTPDSQPVYLQRHFRIYFPTEKTVSVSRGGTSAAGTICMQEKWWKSPAFPRDLLRDYHSARNGLLLHSKAIFVRGNTREGADWAYVGSANLSESAWGRLVKDRELKVAKLTCRNWECGVLVAVGDIADNTDNKTEQGADRGAQVQAQKHDEKEGVEKQEDKAAREEKPRGRRQWHHDAQDESAGLDAVFGETVPIPMKVPAGRYRSDDSAAGRPWFFSEAD